MIALWSAAVFFLASHFGTATSRLRERLVLRRGEHGYFGSYSLVTLVAFAGLVAADRRAPLDVVWIALDALKLALVPIMLLALVLAVAGRTTPNPTIVGAERLFDRPDCVRWILRGTREPVPVGLRVVGSGPRDRDGRHRGILTFGSVGVLGLAAPSSSVRRAAGMPLRRTLASLGSTPVLAAVLFGAAVAERGRARSPVADRGML